jgi:metallophosphoesterase superfamily enzyme
MTRRKGLQRADVEHVIVCNDVHVPFQDVFATAAFSKRIDDAQPQILVLNGDIADLLSMSQHDDGKRKPLLRDELEPVHDFLSDMRRRMKKRKIHLLEGNHEWRYQRFIAKMAPALEGMETTQSLLRLADFGIGFTPYAEVWRVGKIGFTHGNRKISGQGFARAHMRKYGCNLSIGHYHQAQIHTEPVYGESKWHVRGVFAIPCLAPVDADYVDGPTGWSQGHGEFWVERKTGLFTPDVVIYTEQRFWRDGYCYDGRA